MNFAPDRGWDAKEARMQRVLTLVEQRHYLSFARKYGEAGLARRITDADASKSDS